MIAVLVTAVRAAATFTFNSIAGTDYGFLNGKPHTAGLLEVVLSGQTNSLGRGYGAAPITDWCNPSIAHQSLCTSTAVFEPTIPSRGLSAG
jgi:hypothetical protein